MAAASSDLEFPDELDTPRDVAARVRFARYRGLKSMRSTPWDPYENLPVDYARIFQFRNFKKTKSNVLKGINTSGVITGTKVVVWVKDVPRDVLGMVLLSLDKLTYIHSRVASRRPSTHSLLTPPSRTQNNSLSLHYSSS